MNSMKRQKDTTQKHELPPKKKEKKRKKDELPRSLSAQYATEEE